VQIGPPDQREVLKSPASVQAPLAIDSIGADFPESTTSIKPRVQSANVNTLGFSVIYLESRWH
jgi:hypothetical protein